MNPHLSASDREDANFIYELNSIENSEGDEPQRFSKWMCVQSPLTKAEYKVKAVFSREGRNLGVVVGYLVSINIPACTVGNNALIENFVYSAAKSALLMLRIFLLKRGVKPAVVDMFSLDEARLELVTLTYLFDCGDQSSAVATNQKLMSRGEALKNRSAMGGRKPGVFSVGSESAVTAYFNERTFKIKSYVKFEKIKRSFAIFPSREVQNEVYQASANLLRIEIDLKRSWLKEHKLENPAAWRNTKSHKPTLKGLEVIRQYLRLDESLRMRRPQAGHMKRLAAPDRTILEEHMAGFDVRNCKGILEKSSKLARQKYFSAVKKRIYDELEIDISIRWDDQCRKLWPELSSLLDTENLYRIPAKLKPHSYCLDTVRSAIKKLERSVGPLSDKMDSA